MLDRFTCNGRHPLAAGKPARASREQYASSPTGAVRPGAGSGGVNGDFEKQQRGRSVTRAR
jgi:hypothetical protein